VSRSANTTSDTFVRAPQLRGLPADETLLLVDGHRRHKSASVQVDGYASQAADSATIPSIALKTIEVLRDGAAAQYGSDAIAGVINYQLKDADHGVLWWSRAASSMPGTARASWFRAISA
jgi:iron complex outermembrane receptor protein